MDDTSALRRLLAASLLTLVAGVPVATAQAAPTPAAATAPAATTAPAASKAPLDPRVVADSRLAPARAVLAANRPLTISVLGDSVGNDPGEWVSKAAEAWADDRVVVVHHFDWQKVAWLPRTEVFAPDGEPAKPQVTVWNFGWPGGTPLRAAQHLELGVPTKPDLAIVSFGHNLAPASVVPQYDALATALTKRWGKVATVTTLAHMTPVVRPGQAEGRARLARWLQARGLPYIDERRVFDTGPGERPTVFHDAIHPNWLGYRLIADLVDAALSTPSVPAAPAAYGSAKVRALLTARTQSRSNRTTAVKVAYAFRDGFGRPMAHAWVTLSLKGTRNMTVSLETDASGRASGAVSLPNGGSGTLSATADDGFTVLTARPLAIWAR